MNERTIYKGQDLEEMNEADLRAAMYERTAEVVALKALLRRARVEQYQEGIK